MEDGGRDPQVIGLGVVAQGVTGPHRLGLESSQSLAMSTL